MKPDLNFGALYGDWVRVQPLASLSCDERERLLEERRWESSHPHLAAELEARVGLAATLIHTINKRWFEGLVVRVIRRYGPMLVITTASCRIIAVEAALLTFDLSVEEQEFANREIQVSLSKAMCLQTSDASEIEAAAPKMVRRAQLLPREVSAILQLSANGFKPARVARTVGVPRSVVSRVLQEQIVR